MKIVACVALSCVEFCELREPALSCADAKEAVVLLSEKEKRRVLRIKCGSSYCKELLSKLIGEPLFHLSMLHLAIILLPMKCFK